MSYFYNVIYSCGGKYNFQKMHAQHFHCYYQLLKGWSRAINCICICILVVDNPLVCMIHILLILATNNTVPSISRTCSRMTFTLTRQVQKPPWKLRNGLKGRMETLSSYPWNMDTSQARTAISKWSRRTSWTIRWARIQRILPLLSRLPPPHHLLWVRLIY